MRNILVASILVYLISCDENESREIDKCSLTNSNPIQNVKRNGTIGDTINLRFKGIEYELRPWSGYITLEYYNYILDNRSVVYGTDFGELTCRITLYYPGDSSYFNNRDFLSRFKIRDSDTPSDRMLDSLVFARGCSFNFYIEVFPKPGESFKSLNRSDNLNNFFQIDSIKYITTPNNLIAQWKLYGHFQTRVRNEKNKAEEDVEGTVAIQFDTERL